MSREDRRTAQYLTGRVAIRTTLPWTAAEDAELLSGAGTVAQRAKRLCRSYYAADKRLRHLRRSMAAGAPESPS